MRERARAAAKVNLYLRVGELQPTGYHDIDTLFCALELADELTIDLADGRGVRLEVEGADVGPVDENLAVRAARSFTRLAGTEHEVSIRLRKRIPAGGGLGGGSSDAAAVLAALDRMLPGAVERAALEQAARDLGSDVPFFLSGRAAAWGAGRGERLSHGPDLPSLPVLLAVPRFPVATAEAYQWLDDSRRADPFPPDVPPTRPITSWDEIAALATNDFEGPVFGRHPALREIREVMAGAGALVSMLAGSGSTVFGVFPDEERAGAAAAVLRTRTPDVRLELTRTASR